jgi:hypothetical protein
MRAALLPIALLSCVALVAACSSDDSSSSSSSSTTGGPSNGCAADNRKDIYTAGLTKPAGDLQVKLLESKPGPPIKGTNELQIEVMDAGGAPLDGATLTVVPFMPDHGHGSALAPVTKPLGGGKYSVEKVYLSMSGLWRLTVSVQMPGGAIKEAAFQFCVDG